MNSQNLADNIYSSLGKYTSAKCGSGIEIPYFVSTKLNFNANGIAYQPLCLSANGCIQQYTSSNVNNKEMSECQRSMRRKPMSEM